MTVHNTLHSLIIEIEMHTCYLLLSCVVYVALYMLYYSYNFQIQKIPVVLYMLYYSYNFQIQKIPVSSDDLTLQSLLGVRLHYLYL